MLTHSPSSSRRTRVAPSRAGWGGYWSKDIFDDECDRDHRRTMADDVLADVEAARQVVSFPIHTYRSDSEVDRSCAP
jgi:hypothetical protein